MRSLVPPVQGIHQVLRPRYKKINILFACRNFINFLIVILQTMQILHIPTKYLVAAKLISPFCPLIIVLSKQEAKQVPFIRKQLIKYLLTRYQHVRYHPNLFPFILRKNMLRLQTQSWWPYIYWITRVDLIKGSIVEHPMSIF